MRTQSSRAARGTIALALGAVAGFVLAVAVSGAWQPAPGTLRGPGGDGPRWVEIKWPFPSDMWSAARAFRCAAADCGSEVTLYVRAKVGFCNCLTGVSDDEELERMSDFYLIGGRHAASDPGRPITVGAMKGRSRTYVISDTAPSGKSALMIAYNDRCDAIVGTAIVGHEKADAVERVVIDFLNGDTITKFAQMTLGL